MVKEEDGKFIVSVKVGPKGQITVPAIARKTFNINEGDTLMIMGDVSRGIALVKAEEFYKFMGDTFYGGDKN